MNKLDLRTPMIYLLMIIIVILLIVLKKMDDNSKIIALEEAKKEKVELVDEKKAELKERIAIIEDPLPKYIGLVGIVIDDFGYRNDQISDGFLELDADLTYAIIPGHNHSVSFGEKAVSAGYEVIVHMPMENTGKTYGEEKFVLMTDMDNDTIQRRLNTALNLISMAVGMNNHQGSKASADQHVMSNVARIIKERDLFFLDSRTTVETIVVNTMEIFGVPTAQRNIFLDNDDDEAKIKQQLMKLIKKAKKDGSAIGIGHVKLKTLNVLKKEIPQLKKAGFKFEFVSKMVH